MTIVDILAGLYLAGYVVLLGWCCSKKGYDNLLKIRDSKGRRGRKGIWAAEIGMILACLVWPIILLFFFLYGKRES